MTQYTHRPLPNGRYEVHHIVGTCDTRDEAALMVDELNAAERHPELNAAESLRRLGEACGVEEVVYERT